MSEQSIEGPPTEPRVVNIDAWIERARRDPVAYIERQATEVVLTAIGELPGYLGVDFHAELTRDFHREMTHH
ncbi:hypothetical protein [Niveispirillum cyanobacteriorum]|uniref:hypothetical protein n=1 Tax=Niveispirillum cyanobacteriorum TaxID=1612173 RepID=UPI00166AABE3|nr:hypothetical protein [Niveispirillum cyanobacteriorum]GGE89505.1 hypothetical protein GCM10011317_53120 [Niveispirillum cyanobacteriorum]